MRCACVCVANACVLVAAAKARQTHTHSHSRTLTLTRRFARVCESSPEKNLDAHRQRCCRYRRRRRRSRCLYCFHWRKYARKYRGEGDEKVTLLVCIFIFRLRANILVLPVTHWQIFNRHAHTHRQTHIPAQGCKQRVALISTSCQRICTLSTSTCSRLSTFTSISTFTANSPPTQTHATLQHLLP